MGSQRQIEQEQVHYPFLATRCVFDLHDGFPLLTTKKLHLKSIIYELVVVFARRNQYWVSKRKWEYEFGMNGQMKMAI